MDGTFGAGGYSGAILDAADCWVWAIDRDPRAVAGAEALISRYADRLKVIEGCFGDMERLLGDQGVGPVDGIAFDLGVSSMQLDDGARGFSFRHDGLLDMRMGCNGPSAADVVNTMDEEPLADLIHRFGEERRARRIAHAIVKARSEAPITRTGRLADIVRGAQPAPRRNKGGKVIDPATRTFQALRIYVNDELGELGHGLSAAEALLAPGGRLAVVSFHSLEDREVKNFLQSRTGRTARASRHLPETSAARLAATFILLSRGVIKPAAEEVAANPRARSARLRAAERTSEPIGAGQ